MTSKQNSNVKNTFKFKFQILNLIKMLQTWFLKISLHPYYSSRIGWNILLYESLWFTILVCLRAFFLDNCKSIQKIEFLNFFSHHFFFLDKMTFLQAEAWAAAASRAAAEIFFTFIAFFMYFNLKIWSNLENFNFWKIIKFDHFLSKCETFVRNFNLDKTYRHTIPFAWHIFR